MANSLSFFLQPNHSHEVSRDNVYVQILFQKDDRIHTISLQDCTYLTRNNNNNKNKFNCMPNRIAMEFYTQSVVVSTAISSELHHKNVKDFLYNFINLWSSIACHSKSRLHVQIGPIPVQRWRRCYRPVNQISCSSIQWETETKRMLFILSG